MRRLPLLLLPLLLGCPPNRPGTDGDGSPCAAAQGTSSLPGVCIVFDSDGDSWTLDEAAAGIGIDYTLHVEQDLSDVVALTQDAGGCGQRGPHNLILFERLGSGETEYCLCDEGLCQGPDELPRPVPAGSWGTTFVWEGRSWFGPSDFGNPMGDPFPPGTYDFVVRAVGRHDGANYEVSSTFAVELTE